MSSPTLGLLPASSASSRALISSARPSVGTGMGATHRASDQDVRSAASVRLIGPRGRGVVMGHSDQGLPSYAAGPAPDQARLRGEEVVNRSDHEDGAVSSRS